MQSVTLRSETLAPRAMQAKSEGQIKSLNF